MSTQEPSSKSKSLPEETSKLNPDSIIIDRCGYKDYHTIWDTLYIIFIPNLLVFLSLAVGLIIVVFAGDYNNIFYSVLMILVWLLPYIIISSRIRNIKRNCVDYGKQT